MMPVVRINDASFVDIKTLSTWFGTKTPAETIERIVREAMEQLGLERDEEADATVTMTSEGTMEFKEAPGLAFTKPLSAKVNGKVVRNPRWASILLAMIEEVKETGLDAAKLVKALNVQAKVGRYEEEGFKHYAELGISIQGQSASDAWREIDRLAKEFSVPVMVEFWWRRNAKAQFPGRTGLLRSGK